MKKKLLFKSLFILLISTSLFANEIDCNQFDKLSAKYIECTAKKLKTSAGEKLNVGKKKLDKSSLIKDLGEHPEDKKPVRIMKGQYGPYIKYKSLNATIPEEKDPNELTMEEALILIEKRKEYDKTKKKGKRK